MSLIHKLFETRHQRRFLAAAAVTFPLWQSLHHLDNGDHTCVSSIIEFQDPFYTWHFPDAHFSPYASSTSSVLSPCAHIKRTTPSWSSHVHAPNAFAIFKRLLINDRDILGYSCSSCFTPLDAAATHPPKNWSMIFQVFSVCADLPLIYWLALV